MARMIPIYLEERQERILRRVAKEQNTSLNSLVRRGVDLLLQRLPAEQDPAWQLAGIGSSDEPDLGKRHDDFLISELQREGRRGKR
jgi:hypothetical protein